MPSVRRPFPWCRLHSKHGRRRWLVSAEASTGPRRMTPEAALEAIGRARVVAVIRADSARDAVEVARATYRGGIRAIEIATTTPDAAAAIAEVRELLPDAVVGAGTVRSTLALISAVDAGASFVASPGTIAEVIDGAGAAGILAIPGVLTPTEIERAVE